MEMENEVAGKLKLENWRDLEPTWGMKVFLTILYSTMLLIGIVGNSITIKVSQVLLRKGYLQKNVTDHMVSLALSDLLVLLIGLPVELYSAIWFPFSSTSGNVACKVYNFLFEACSYATILNVATLSFERYFAICHPFKYKSVSGDRTVKLIVFAWIASALVALPLLCATGTEGPLDILDIENGSFHLAENVRNLTFCTGLSDRWMMYRSSIFVAFIVYVTVLASVAFMCRSMIQVLRGNKFGAAKQEANSTGARPKHESAKVRASRKQTILFLGLIVGALAGCWIPNQVRRLMAAARPKSDWTTAYFRSYVILHPIADTFFYFSSVLNPFLYNLSSHQFRRVFGQVLRCQLSIEHINRRTLVTSDAISARSMRPLVLRSLRRGRSTASGDSPETLTTFRSPVETPSGPQAAAEPSGSSELSATQESGLTSESGIVCDSSQG
ncbi:G-protein coupled receptor 39-like [Megalops cyprinoides]|uniref:G-protein coupled receptor 39-like n=1 Tax=Megalops cyprinoides TaxID=118141 RepID=UPI001863F275|nr:G-protein coupled receptor 39-like [Megalops cyprinoides]